MDKCALLQKIRPCFVKNDTWQAVDIIHQAHHQAQRYCHIVVGQARVIATQHFVCLSSICMTSLERQLIMISCRRQCSDGTCSTKQSAALFTTDSCWPTNIESRVKEVGLLRRVQAQSDHTSQLSFISPAYHVTGSNTSTAVTGSSPVSTVIDCHMTCYYHGDMSEGERERGSR